MSGLRFKEIFFVSFLSIAAVILFAGGLSATPQFISTGSYGNNDLLYCTRSGFLHKDSLATSNVTRLSWDEKRELLTDIDVVLWDAFKNPESPLYVRLLRRLGPYFYTENSKLIDVEYSGWQFFFNFLKYYAPNGPNYNELSVVAQQVLDQLFVRFEQFVSPVK